jgi:hypothetical protein
MTLLGIAPALPLHAAGKYVAGAYIVFVLVILIYVAIMAVRLGRMERQLVELNRDLERRDQAATEQDRDPGSTSAEPESEPDAATGSDAHREPAPVSGSGRLGDSSL